MLQRALRWIEMRSLVEVNAGKISSGAAKVWALNMVATSKGTHIRTSFNLPTMRCQKRVRPRILHL